MKKLFFLFLVISNMAYGQIKNFEDESQYMLSLQELVSQSFAERYVENASSKYKEPYEGMIRQHFQFDPMSMNFVFYKTHYDEDEKNKAYSDIQWLTKFVISLYEIDSITFTQKKNTMTIKTKGGRPSIQSYMIMSGNEYYPATKEKEINIQSDKLLKIRNITHRLNRYISELQKFHVKKMDLVNYLNSKLKQEVAYQVKDTLNYPANRKFKLTQEFQLDKSGQWLSIIVERKNVYGNPLVEKQSIQLKDVRGVLKDIDIALQTRDNNVMKTTTITNNKTEKRVIETVDVFFFLQFWYEKNNGHISDEIVALLKPLGLTSNSAWLD